jgi:hypothetical protein
LENLFGEGGVDKANGLLGRIAGFYFSMIDRIGGLGYSAGAIEDFYNDVHRLVSAIAQRKITKEVLLDEINTVRAVDQLLVCENL